MRMRSIGLAVAMAFVWAPAAHATFPGHNGKLAVVQDNSCPEPADDDPPRVIKAYSPGGKDLGRLTGCDANRYGPDWSSQGTRLAYTRTGNSVGFFSRKANGTGETSMNMPAEADFDELNGPSCSPSGKRVVFTKNDSIWTAKTDGTGMKRLLRRPCPHCIEIRSPHWSPNGKQIAFEANFAGKKGFRPGIWVMSAKNGKHRRRLTDRGHEPDWAPNSRRIVYRTDYENHESGGASGGNLFVVRVKNGHTRRVLHTKTEAATVPFWSPTGKSIAYVELRFGAGDVSFSLKARLMRIPAGGGRKHRIHKLPDPTVEEGFFSMPDISWQPRP